MRTSSTREKRSERTISAWARSSSQASSGVRTPCHAIMFATPNSRRSAYTRAVHHASAHRCCARDMRWYFRSTYSRTAPSGKKQSRSVKKASTVCIPFTSDSLRAARYSASRFELGTRSTDALNGTFTSPGSSVTMDPAHDSASMLMPWGVMVRPVQTRSTMHLMTRHRPSSCSCSVATAPASFSQANRMGCSACALSGSRSGSATSSTNTLSMPGPSEHENDVACSTARPSSAAVCPNMRPRGGASPSSDSRSLRRGTLATVSPLTLRSIELSSAKVLAHRSFGRCTTAKGVPDLATAGTTRPSPRRPAPKCR